MMTAAEIYQAARWISGHLAPIRAELAGMIRRVVVGSSTGDAGDTVRSNGTTYGNAATDGEHLQQYGFGSRPPSGSEGLFFRRHGVIVCADFRAGRPELADGEVSVWHRSGAMCVFREDGSIALLPKAGQKIEIGGEPGASLVARADKVEAELADIQAQLTGHTHSGVTTGVGNTGTSSSVYVAGTVGADNARVT